MSDKRAHLEMIQGVIDRMARNSFQLKGWTVTLVSALFALAAAGAETGFVYLAWFPAIAFWFLDAYYLRQERLFRALFDDVRVLDENAITFSMNTAPHAEQVDSLLITAFSNTLLGFHGTVVASIVIAMVVVSGWW